MFKFLFLFLSIFIITKQDDDISHIGLYNEILEQGIEFPDIVFAQAILESAHFQSKLFKENRNIFGMRVPSKRQSSSVGSKNGYSLYVSWRDSVVDYYYYQEMVLSKKKMTREQYFQFLDKNYAEAGSYSKKLKEIIIRYKKILYLPLNDRNDGVLKNKLVFP